MIAFSAVLLALGLLCAWKAAAVGRVLRRMDGGRLERQNHDLGGDARSYTLFVRQGSLMFAALGLIGIAGQLLKSWPSA